MGVTLLGSFSIMRFEITKINFYELIRNKSGAWRFLFGETYLVDYISDLTKNGVCRYLVVSVL